MDFVFAVIPLIVSFSCEKIIAKKIV